jgi:hypothetical protein
MSDGYYGEAAERCESRGLTGVAPGLRSLPRILLLRTSVNEVYEAAELMLEVFSEFVVSHNTAEKV